MDIGTSVKENENFKGNNSKVKIRFVAKTIGGPCDAPPKQAAVTVFDVSREARGDV
jgi:hypothetical protein